MQLQVLRPVRASASSLLARTTCTDATTDYRQQTQMFNSSSDSVCVAVPLQNPAGGLHNGCASSTPIMPITSGSPPVQANVANAPHSSWNSQVPQCSDVPNTGCMTWFQPVVWQPVFQVPMMGGEVQVAPCGKAADDATCYTPQNYEGCMQPGGFVVAVPMPPCDTDINHVTGAHVPPLFQIPPKASKFAVPMEGGGSHRQQRRQKQDNGDDSAALCPSELEELRRAVHETTLRLRDASMGSPYGFSSDPMCKLGTSTDKSRHGLEDAISTDVSSNTTEVSPRAECDLDPLLAVLEDCDANQRQATLAWVISSTWSLALTKRGCRLVQRALEVGTSAEKEQIAEKLHGHVCEALKSPHANFVLQRCIELLPSERIQFVLTELKGDAGYAAAHRFGCRILQRLIEQCPSWRVEALITEILEDAGKLCRHQYGNFVIQHILQHGSATHQHEIAEVLRRDTIRLAKHRIASHVLSSAMVHCATEDVRALTQAVLQDAGQLADLSRRQYGSFVVREVQRVAKFLDVE